MLHAGRNVKKSFIFQFEPDVYRIFIVLSVTDEFERKIRGVNELWQPGYT